jgi:hypothetical protein
MEGDLEKSLNAVLSDPEQMGKLAQIAKQFMGQGESEPAQEAQQASEPDLKLFGMLKHALSGGSTSGNSTALLKAMRSYLRPEKQQKMDKAMNLAKVVHIAGSVMKDYGDGNGL